MQKSAICFEIDRISCPVIELLDSTPKAQTNAIRVPIRATATSAEGSSPLVTVETRIRCDAKGSGPFKANLAAALAQFKAGPKDLSWFSQQTGLAHRRHIANGGKFRISLTLYRARLDLDPRAGRD